MEQRHRENIMNNIDKLIENTEYDELMDACIKNDLVFKNMRDTIEGATPNQIDRHRHLIEKITRRGPKAYDTFERILKQLFPEAAQYLTKTVNDVSIRNRLRAQPSNGQLQLQTLNIPNSQLPQASNLADGAVQSLTNRNGKIDLIEYTGETVPNMNITVKCSTKIHINDKSNVKTYSMNSKNRGIFVLVNNIDFPNKKNEKRRNGADVDRDNLVHLFRQMNYKVYLHENLTKDKFVQLIRKLSNFGELDHVDSFVLAVLSHGDGNDVTSEIEFVDQEKFRVEDILIQFNNNNCERLIGKPKVFFFPFCRGPLSDIGVKNHRIGRLTERDSGRDKEPEVEITADNIPTFFDMKICYATIPGYNAFRDPRLGSWYIETMCRIFAEHAHDTHLEDLLKLIGDELSKMRTESTTNYLQTAANEDRGFNKILYFNPGYHSDMDGA